LETKERKFATQLISRFFKYFPNYEEAAFDSIVDLCESENVDVRKHAVLALLAICRDCKHFVSRAADILIQLYQSNQMSEVNLINQSLMTLIDLDIQKFLQSFFANFEDGSEIVRERALKFLASKIQTIRESSLTREVEEQLLTYSKKATEDVTKEEFLTFIGILSKLKIAKTATGQAMIMLVIKSQAELDKDFDPNNTDTLDKFLHCTKHTIPLLSQYNRASEYINYICLKILPHLKTLASTASDLSVLQALAEMSPFIHADDIPKLIDLEQCQQAVFDKLLEYLPLPKTYSDPIIAKGEDVKPKIEPSDQGDQDKIESKAGVEEKVKEDEADFQFTHIEYLIFTFHQFGRFRPEFLDENRLSIIRKRLQHLSAGCKKYMELLSAQLRGIKSSEDLKKEENKLRSVALRTTKNISVIIIDFFMRPPSFKTNVLLSCKPLTARPIDPISPDKNDKTNKNQARKGGSNSYTKPGYDRQVGQKHKYRQNYQVNDKRTRFSR